MVFTNYEATHHALSSNFVLLSSIKTEDWSALFSNPVYGLSSMSQNTRHTNIYENTTLTHTNLYFNNNVIRKQERLQTWSYIISYHILFSFCRSVQDYKIHMDMEIVIFVGIKKWNQHNSVQQCDGPVQCWVLAEYKWFSITNIIK